MSVFQFSRAASRGCLRTNILYERNGNVRKGTVENISKTGILLSKARSLDVGEKISFMIKLPIYPVFQNLSAKKIRSQSQNKEKRAYILRVSGKIVRAFTTDNGYEAGVHFSSLSDDAAAKIEEYIDLYGQNTIFILNLFEQMGDNEHCVEVIRVLSGLLGYDSGLSLNILRQKILHDYQNLEI